MSLIQPSHISKSGEVEFCQVHDTILDFIVCMSVEHGVPNAPFKHMEFIILSIYICLNKKKQNWCNYFGDYFLPYTQSMLWQ
jgi:hypothetical protein